MYSHWLLIIKTETKSTHEITNIISETIEILDATN
jgi:hypothetical protein